MKKLVLPFLIIYAAINHVNAQSEAFSERSRVLNLGVGLGSTWYSGTYYEVKTPPVSASLEFGIADYILERGSVGLGPYVGYSSFKYEKGPGGYRYENILAGARCNFHYPFIERMDTYISLLVGYNYLKSTPLESPDGPPEESRMRSALYIGIRYYLAEIFALMAEAGYGITYFNVGMTFKFEAGR